VKSFACMHAILCTLVASGCSDALIYGERTSVSVAAIRLNDDPAQPIRLKVGFGRDVVSVAPPLGGAVAAQEAGTGVAAPSGATDAAVGNAQAGEAVSQVSTFNLKVTAPFFASASEDQQILRVHSRFASGEAALKVAGSAGAVAAIVSTDITGFQIARQEKYRRCLADDKRFPLEKLVELAKTLVLELDALEQKDAAKARGRILDFVWDQRADRTTEAKMAGPCA